MFSYIVIQLSCKNTFMKNFFTFILILSTSISFAQLNIVPMPSQVKIGKGKLILKEPLAFIVNTSFSKGDGGISLFKKYLTSNYGFTKFKDGDTHSYGLPTEIFLEINNKSKEDDYYIDVQKNRIKLSGNDKGIFYAFETLKQIISKNKNEISIPVCTINDSPRFSYRGMHLDVGRHFYTIDYVKKYIDYLATYKFNTFHWHLTEDQGWRIEIKKYPNLTRVGACRDRTIIGRYGSNKHDDKEYCGYYTQAQIKEIVEYATSLYITVIPEIEMPGHSTAALASYPYLGCTKGPYKTMDTWGVLDDVYCAGNDSTFTFLQDVIDEVIALFPSTYIHIGGDECPKERWKKCAACQQRMKDNNLKDEHALQSYFIQRMEKYINSKGRKIIGWDEILEGGLAPNATVMSWRGEQGGIEAAKQGHDVIMTPGSHCYFDHSQTKNEDSLTIGSYLPLEKVYGYEPIPAVLNATDAKHVLGAQGNVWTEYISNTSKLEYMIFPRMIALSEVLWTAKGKRNWNDFEKRLPIILERLNKQKINYSKAYYELALKILPTENNEGIYWEANSKTNGLLKVKGEADTFETLSNQDKSIKVKIVKSGNFTLTQSAKGFTTSTSQNFTFNKATGKKITLRTEPNEPYKADGAFTLVNGVQNTKGMARSTEFIGFNGTDMEATIEFDKDVEISSVSIHFLDKNNSWIYLPSEIEVVPIPYYDPAIKRLPPLEATSKKVIDKNKVQVVIFEEKKICRSIRVFAKNFGKIPAGNAGEGNPAWLFVDEIEIN